MKRDTLSRPAQKEVLWKEERVDDCVSCGQDGVPPPDGKRDTYLLHGLIFLKDD